MMSMWASSTCLIAIASEGSGDSVKILKEFDIDQEKIYQALVSIRGSHRVDDPGLNPSTGRWKNTAAT